METHYINNRHLVSAGHEPANLHVSAHAVLMTQGSGSDMAVLWMQKLSFGNNVCYLG